MNGENKPIGPAPLPDNIPSTPTGASGPPPSSPPPPPPTGAMPAGGQGPQSGPPPPPPPQIDIRTMASDAESLKSTGGMATKPKTFSPADLAKEPVFGAEIVSPAPATPRPGGAGKKLALALGAVAILAAAAAVGYFFVWPLFTGEEEVTETAPPPQPTGGLPTPPPPPPSHQSYFKTAPSGGTKSVSLSSLTLSELVSALKATSGEATSTALVKEVAVSVSGKALTSTALVAVILPGSGLETYLEGDATVYAYYTGGKSYPGYVFKLKENASSTAAKTAAAKIEQSTNLTALYPESPGAAKGTWKSGSVSGVNTRYQAYSTAGASLNYGWLNNYLVISTSYDGFKKALELLPR